MNRIFTIITLLFSVSALLLSCVKEQSGGNDGDTFSLIAGYPSVPAELTGRWSDQDALLLIGEKKQLISKSHNGNQFSFEGTPDGLTWVMFANDSEGKPASYVALNGKKITVNAASEQNVFEGMGIPRSGMVALGEVKKTGESTYETGLSPANAFLSFNLTKYSTIKKIILSSKEAIALYGELEIDTDFCSGKLLGGNKTVSLSCQDATFSKGDKKYCFCLAPNLTFTPVFTFTDINGKTGSIEWDSQIKTSLSKNVILSDIDKNLELESVKTMPDTLILNVNAGWRFSHDMVASDKQDAKSGESYSYMFVAGNGFSADLPFVFCKGSQDGSEYAIKENSDGNKYISFTKAGAWIKLPAIEGRHLEYVSMEILNTAGKSYTVSIAPGSDTIFESGRFVGKGTARFNQRGNPNTVDNNGYYVCIDSWDNIMISSLTLTYIKESGGYVFDGTYYRDQPLTEWEKAAKKRADLFYQISWTAKNSTFPTQKFGEFFVNGNTYRGIPYSSHWSRGNGARFVGLGVSFYTFLSSINNSESMIYTKDFHYIPDTQASHNGKAGAIYGAVCSTTVSYLLGYPNPYTTHQIFSGLTPSLIDVGTDWAKIQLFDAPTVNGDDSEEETVYDTNHTMMIYDIGRDADGKVQEVTVEEAWGAKLTSYSAGTRRVTYSFNDFCKRMSDYGYHNFRVNQDEFSYSLPPCIEQSLEEVKMDFPENVCFNQGDCSMVILPQNQTDTMIVANVLKLGSYNKINLKKNGALNSTKTVTKEGSQSFRVGEGLYEIYLSSGSSVSVSTRFQVVADQYAKMSAQYSSGIIYVTAPSGFAPVTVGNSGRTVPCCGKSSDGRYMFRFPEEWKTSDNSLSVKMAGEYGIYSIPRKISIKN